MSAPFGLGDHDEVSVIWSAMCVMRYDCGATRDLVTACSHYYYDAHLPRALLFAQMSVIILDFVSFISFLMEYLFYQHLANRSNVCMCVCVCLYARVYNSFKTALSSEHLYRYVKFASDKRMKGFCLQLCCNAINTSECVAFVDTIIDKFFTRMRWK